jgi:hypothetical protein
MDSTFYKSNARQLSYLDQGLLTFDQKAATDCLVAMTKRVSNCDAQGYSLPPTAVCTKVLIPSAPVGSLCDPSVPTCSVDSVCMGGFCVALPKADQPCLPGMNLCAQGLVCKTTVAPLLCKVLSKIGQPCGNGCITGSVCDGTLCTAMAESGESCATKPCNPQSNLSCGPNMICGSPQPDGTPCVGNNQCQSGLCHPMLMTCQAPLTSLTLRQQLCGIR